MNSGQQSNLDFEALDDLAFAAQLGVLREDAIPNMGARNLGPVIEHHHLGRCGLLPRPLQAKWLSLDLYRGLLDALDTGKEIWTCPSLGNVGFFRTRRGCSRRHERQWTSFGLRCQQAAKIAGFTGNTAAQFVGAIGELRSNIHEHSNAEESGLVLFSATKGRFEFAVSDQGIGVMASLNGGTQRHVAEDHGEALRLALTEGVSRYGDSVGRGYGFRPLFVGLANLHGALRFRSGDHTLTIDGYTPTVMTARIAEKPKIQGFVITVLCHVLSKV